jgi:nicotinate-nucleotide pyrophosphorylase (carboxylating)
VSDVPADLTEQVRRALAEDVGTGDITAQLIPEQRTGRARVIAREAAVICGRPWVDETFAQLGNATVTWHIDEGSMAAPNQLLFEVRGQARTLLTGERTALNFLQTLSATATSARRYVDLLRGTTCKVLDTRKTLPGLRSAQKYAVRIGGATNHRMGLYDAVLIKENHIVAAGSIAAAIAESRRLHPAAPIEVEVENLEEFRLALSAGADMALLDEFTLDQLREAATLNAAAARPMKLEASGGISRDSIRAIAETGVDFVSVGSITKHLHAVDLSMRFVWDEPT